MSSVIENWKVQLAALPQDERTELAHFLLSSLGPQEDGAEAAWDSEATRRVQEVLSGAAPGRSADQFLDELRERYP